MVNYEFLKGTGVALITPFAADKSIDYNGLEKVINHCIDGGVNYLVSMGTTGESVTLTKEEKQAVIRFTVKITNDRIPIVIGIGGIIQQNLLKKFKYKISQESLQYFLVLLLTINHLKKAFTNITFPWKKFHQFQSLFTMFLVEPHRILQQKPQFDWHIHLLNLLL